MELRHLRYFVAVAEVENVSLAAERLHVSQPPLSRQIHQLEDELGVALFERTAKSIRLTEAGEIFAREARAILERVDRAMDTVREAAGAVHAKLRVGYAPSLTIKVLPEALREFQSGMPAVKIQLCDLSTAEMLDHLREKKLDVALLVYPGKAALRGLEFYEVQRHPACVVLPKTHSLAKTRSPHIRDLAGESVIGFTKTDYPEYYKWLASVFNATGRRPNVTEEHDSIVSLIAAVESGRGITFGAQGFKELAGRRLTVRRLAPPVPPVVVGVVCVKNTANPVVQQFMSSLYRQCGAVVPASG